MRFRWPRRGQRPAVLRAARGDALARGDKAFCHKCHDAKDAIVGSTSAAKHASLLANMQGSSYGRALQCLKDRDQRVALGAPVEMGAPGYVEMGEPGYVTSIRALVAHATG